MNENIFSWDAMNAGNDPFAKDTLYETDDRFYTLPKDKEGKGAAIIRFLPDGEMRENGSMGTIQKVFKINTTFTREGKKRFVNEFSPTTIGKPDPFQEEWSRLYNNNQRQESKEFNRATRYITNIKIIKDPACPENEGKIFLLDMSFSLAQKIQNIIQPSEEDMALGAKPKALFNPMKGYNFRLVSRKGANGIINYDSSTVDESETSIYSTTDEAVEDLKNNAHKLSWFLDEKNYKSYDWLKERLAWVQFKDNKEAKISEAKEHVANTYTVDPSDAPFDTGLNQKTQTAQNTQASQTVTPSVDQELDDLINGITK